MDNKNDLDIKPKFEGGGGRWDGEDIITLHVEDQLGDTVRQEVFRNNNTTPTTTTTNN